MTALAAGRITKSIPSSAKNSAPCKASTTVYAGSIVMLDASGYAQPGAATAGCYAVGCARSNSGKDRYDNSSGSNGDIDVDYDEGIFGWGNSASEDAIADSDRGRPCYIADDQTVALTSLGGTRPPAGYIVRVESSIVYVEMSAAIGRKLRGHRIVTIPVTLSAHSNSSIAARFTPGHAGHIVKMTASVKTAVTTGSKAATFTPAVATVATTGGAVALTSANCTPVGAKVDGTAITAGAKFGPTDEITIAASSVTAFVEGEVLLHLHLANS